ncbi:hypothetical protein, partial [Thiolapillus sp.]|uniref:hypothetical protein n=1 Tax=Thiolapillus sp. TaxID=2017437 RepID=UPI003AF4C4E9
TSGRVSATPNTDGDSTHDMVCIIQHLRAELAAVKASQKADREHFKIEIDSLNTTIGNMKSRMQDMEAKLKVYKDKEAKKQCNFSEKTSKQAAPPTPKTSSPSNPPADGGASGKEPSVETLMPKTNPLSNSPAADGAGKEHSVKRIQNPISNDNRNLSPKPSSRENEGRYNNHKQQAEVLTVLPDTTLLYIGDSVLSGLHEKKMGCSERDKSQVIFTSGLTLAGLISKLSKPFQPSRKVICVNVHVGINDCRNGRVIKKETWSNAIHALRRCFPSARVNLSSILPLNDSSGHVAYCINKSNDNMYHAVWDKGELFTDNDETFYTRSWDVKSSWYRDGLNPNKRGSSSLARNLKRTIRSTRHRPSQKSSQHAPYLQAAAYVDYVRDSCQQRGHQSLPILHQHGQPATSHSPAQYTPHADMQDRRTYSEVVSYGAKKTQANQVHREHDQSLLASPLQNQQTAASSLKQPQPAVPPVHQIYLSMVEKLIEFGKILHGQ